MRESNCIFVLNKCVKNRAHLLGIDSCVLVSVLTLIADLVHWFGIGRLSACVRGDIDS